MRLGKEVAKAESCGWVHYTEKARWVLPLEDVCLEVSRKDPNKMFISSPGGLFRVLGSTDWPVPGQGVISGCSWSSG